jgi:molybdopterin-guanine dinucleotide biosynthesis protein A
MPGVSMPNVSESDASRDSAASICAAAGFVLAGGQSSRMGRDKALLLFAGRPLIEHSLSTLCEAGLQASIAGASRAANSALAAYGSIVEDAQPGLGPLAGICAALAAASTRYVVFLPVDLPLLPPSLIAYLVHYAQITGRAVTVPAVNGFMQTFPVVLDRSVLPALETELRSGKRGCFSGFQAAAEGMGQPIASIAVELLVSSGQVAHPLGLPPLRWFLNVNTPQDLERAEVLWSEIIA